MPSVPSICRNVARSFSPIPTPCRGQHTSAYARHTSAYVSIRQPHTYALQEVLEGSIRQHTRGIRQHTSAYVSRRQQTSADVSIHQPTSAYASLRQHTQGTWRRASRMACGVRMRVASNAAMSLSARPWRRRRSLWMSSHRQSPPPNPLPRLPNCRLALAANGPSAVADDARGGGGGGAGGSGRLALYAPLSVSG